MTDPDAPTAELPAVPRAAAPRRERIRKPGPLPVIAGSIGLFFAVTALLAFQLRRGADPALGAPEPQALAAAPVPRTILVRRVVVTRIVEHRPRRAAGAPAVEGASTDAAPATTTPAPRPAPSAPAPAPLTTRSS
jgi:hypothetical protein